MDGSAPGKEPAGTPRWRWWVTSLGLIFQALAAALYFFGLASWASTTGGGFLGTSESIGKTTGPTVFVVIGGVAALYATAVVGLGRTRSWVLPCIGIAGATLVGMAATWMLFAEYPGLGLAGLGFHFGLYSMCLASVATVLGFVVSLLLRKPRN